MMEYTMSTIIDAQPDLDEIPLSNQNYTKIDEMM